MIVSVVSPSTPPTASLSSSSSSFLFRHPLTLLRIFERQAKKTISRRLQRTRRLMGGRRRGGVCRAELVNDAPFAAAIGACVLNSLIFPIPTVETEDEDGSGPIDMTDARFAVMGIISFVPYFNWLSWVFAWMDSGRQRYLVYSIVYLAPYLRTNLSLSPEESWLPIASIFICILHIQLEISIKNGDLKGIQFIAEAIKLFSPVPKKNNIESKNHQHSHKKDKNKTDAQLPPSHGLRDEVQEWNANRKDKENLDGDERKNQ